MRQRDLIRATDLQAHFPTFIVLDHVDIDRAIRLVRIRYEVFKGVLAVGSDYDLSISNARFSFDSCDELFAGHTKCINAYHGSSFLVRVSYYYIFRARLRGIVQDGKRVVTWPNRCAEAARPRACP